MSMDADALDGLIKSKVLEDRIRAVRRSSKLPVAERQAPLLRLLRDRANYVAAMAAEALGSVATWESAGEMRDRFLWLSEDGLKRDAGCHIRSHLAYGFGRLEYLPARDVLRLGLRTVQIEPVAGVPFDTAASLRANCALALAHLREPDAVREIAPLLFDTGENRIDRIVNPRGIPKRILPEVRKKMAQALAATGDSTAVIPLSIKLRFPGDEAAEVLQECMRAIVTVGAEDAVDALMPYLQHHDSHLAAFAAVMIAETGAPEAAGLIKSTIEDLYGDALRAVILALASVRTDEARDLLMGIADDTRLAARLALVEALTGSLDEKAAACLRKMSESDGNAQVRKAALEALAA